MHDNELNAKLHGVNLNFFFFGNTRVLMAGLVLAFWRETGCKG